MLTLSAKHQRIARTGRRASHAGSHVALDVASVVALCVDSHAIVAYRRASHAGSHVALDVASVVALCVDSHAIVAYVGFAW